MSDLDDAFQRIARDNAAIRQAMAERSSRMVNALARRDWDAIADELDRAIDESVGRGPSVARFGTGEAETGDVVPTGNEGTRGAGLAGRSLGSGEPDGDAATTTATLTVDGS